MATTGTFADDSDDEIVWGLSDRREPPLPSSPSYSLVSDLSGDFVILRRPLSDPPIQSQSRTAAGPQQHVPITATIDVSLANQVANLRISSNPKGSAKRKAKKVKPGVVQNGENEHASTKKQQKKVKKKAKPKLGATPTPGDAHPSPSPSPKAQKTAAPAPAKGRHGNHSNVTKSPVRRGDGNIDVRPVVPTSSPPEVPSLYEEASTFISRFLSSPQAKNDSVCRLTLLQSLIIELGLATSNLPASLTSARAFLKARAFLNIREYISARSQGPDAIRKALYPSKSALIKNFKRNKRNRAPLQWVKDMGLQVLLVGWTH